LGWRVIHMAEFRGKTGLTLALMAALVCMPAGCGRLGSWGAGRPAAEAGAGLSSGAGGAAAPNFGLLGPDAAKLSNAARKQALAAEYKALELSKTGQSVAWSNAADHAAGTVMPGQPYRVGAQNCRQYSHDWRLNGLPHSARGAACRNADGSWTPLN